MTDPSILTAPKPFVFVLMPLNPAFKDTYTFGIKGAAEDVGAYAERLDEQLFTEGMLDRIFNQISKSDVIVADMTNRNPNVFYEVGYAHALGKIVLLLTQNADDIPFDLKHRQHIVYASIDVLRKELRGRLEWAIGESRRRSGTGIAERFSIRLGSLGLEIPASSGTTTVNWPVIEGRVSKRVFSLPFLLRNDSLEGMLNISHVYLFVGSDAAAVPYKYVEQFNTLFQQPSKEYTQLLQRSSPDAYSFGVPTFLHSPSPLESFPANPLDAADKLGTQYRLPISFRDIPPGAVEDQLIDLMLVQGKEEVDAAYRLRFHTASQYVDFGFSLKVQWRRDEPTEEKKMADRGNDKKNGTDSP